MARWPLALVVAAQACAVDASGLPGPGPDAGGPTEDLGARDLGGEDAGGDLGPPPDMPDCVPSPSPEICNGIDDDCDRGIDEEVTVNEPCDGDGDGCLDGRTACLDDDTRCLEDGPERAGDSCDGPDADAVPEGTWACEDEVLRCADDCLWMPEFCNRRDEDCDGIIDEAPACNEGADTCRPVRRGDSIYLICTEPPGGGDSWGEARSECARRGYALAQVDDAAERDWLYTEAGTGEWWIGARTDRGDMAGRQDKGTWTWRPSGASVDPGLWATDEPSGDGSCGHLAFGFGGQLNDIPCTAIFNYICEGVIVP